MSCVRVIQFAVVALLVLSPTVMAFTPACEVVYESFPSCLEFLVGYSDMPTLFCCYNISRLNMVVSVHVMTPGSICWCIEAMVRGSEPPILTSRIKKLNSYCHTHRSFPISASMDCSSIP
ncbi:hypothetical protein MLD38_030551 [Melastoma candidum]|uniref:Uncharacterized protein n=1 Tax=Melastoma candidum TaxID=119954 RepID=A0ACB9MN65_9MYRT|nr:hypothetical protein MLD38_030551 [Melastoma candidum]